MRTQYRTQVSLLNGDHGTGDAYTRRLDDITSNEKRYIRCIDDGLLYDDDIESAF